MAELKLIRLSDLREEPVEWLWEPYIPYGMITLVQGDGGNGKTTMTAALVAAVTSGRALPGCGSSAPAPVIYQNAEDSYTRTILPKLKWFGADCTLVHSIDDSEQELSFKDSRIEEAIVSTGARLLVIDPEQAFFGGANMNSANAVRPLMKQLGSVAERHGCAVVIVGHLGKRTGGKAQYRGLGSVDIFAAARSVLTVGKLDFDENMRAFVQIKNNLAATGKPQAFGLDSTGAFCWLGECDATAEEFDRRPAQHDNQFTKARRLIETALADGEAPAADIMERGEEQGISYKTLNRAKTELGVVSVKRGGKWYWQMPVDVAYTEAAGDDGQAGQDFNGVAS